MNARNKQKYFHTVLVLVISLLLWNPLPASSFSQNGSKAGAAGGDKGGGVTMQTVSGKVVETMNSGGYTYALVKKDGAKIWVALPKSRIVVGNEITCQPGMVMNNFSSPSLKRIFKQIVFSRGITSSSGSAASPEVTPSPDEVTEVPEANPEVPKAKPKNDWGSSF
ncbi:hypothetical protein ACFLZ5_04415 [Thermodesulfobacteriota bacterium]